MTAPTAAATRASLERDLSGNSLPSWRDGWVRALVLFTLALQLFAWSRIEGYQIADSVEYMEIARSFVHGEERVDAGAMRPFGFSGVLVPFFAVADWMQLRDPRAVVWSITVMEIALGCLLVVLTARIGARIGGRACGIAAGFLVAMNPVFLQYSTQPESGIPAGVCLALALERLLDAGAWIRSGTPRSVTFRRALVGGLWLGAAFLVAYKTVLVSGALILLLVVRDRWRYRTVWIAASLGLLIALVVQSVLDWLLYGVFAASIVNYLAANSGSVLSSVFLKIHLVFYGIDGVPLEKQPPSWALSIASDLYKARSTLTGEEVSTPTELSDRGRMGRWFYVIELPRMLPWPAIALLALGVLRALWKRNVAALILLGVFVANVAAMSNKGSKEFRLWLPLLSFLMPVVALGWAFVVDVVLARIALLRPAASAALATSIAFLSLRGLTELETRQFGGYWEAMDWVNARAARTLPARAAAARSRGLAEPEPLRVAAAYHWAVFQRNVPQIDEVKLPAQLNLWKTYVAGPNGHVVEHVDNMAAIEELDVLLVHLPILTENPELLRWVAQHFEVAGAFYDQATYGGLGPILALEKVSPDPRARRLLVERHGVDPRAFQAERHLRGAMDFIHPLDPATERLELLGVEVQTVPPCDYLWITYHWYSAKKPGRDWMLIDRITSHDERNVWDNGHHGGYGALPTSAWEAGSIVSEGYLLIPAAEPYRGGARLRPIGDSYRRGDLVPVRLWMGVRIYGLPPPDGGIPPVEQELVAVRPGTLKPLRPIGSTELETPDGAQFSGDGLTRVRGLLLPVIPAARLPDDGNPVPD